MVMLICNWNCVSVKKESSGHSRLDTCHISWGSELGKKCSWWQIVCHRPSQQDGRVFILMAEDDDSTQDLMMFALALVHNPPVPLLVTRHQLNSAHAFEF